MIQEMIDRVNTLIDSIRNNESENLLDSPFHANNRLLVVCFQNQWKELNYVKSR